jgi:hypothetical protein
VVEVGAVDEIVGEQPAGDPCEAEDAAREPAGEPERRPSREVAECEQERGGDQADGDRERNRSDDHPGDERFEAHRVADLDRGPGQPRDGDAGRDRHPGDAPVRLHQPLARCPVLVGGWSRRHEL